MSFEVLHFRGADEILKSKNMENEVRLTLEYLNDALYGTMYKTELLKQALDEMDWRRKEELNILNGRRYYYKGYRNRVAIDGNLSFYEVVQEALLKLQIGFDKGKLDMGIVLVTGQRSEKSPLGNSKDLVEKELEMLYPTISLPVTVILFDLGKPGGEENGISSGPERSDPQDPIISESHGTDQVDKGSLMSLDDAQEGNLNPRELPSEIQIPIPPKKKRTRKKTDHLSPSI